jgi:ribosomal protein L7/L12
MTDQLGFCKCCGGQVSLEAVTCPHCGQPRPYDTGYDKDQVPIGQVKRLVRQGNRIDAIKLVRERTGWGLDKAKAYVDAI